MFDKCDVCGKTALLKTCFNKVILCKKCDALINASSWNKGEFSSKDEVLSKKEEALNLAKANNFPDKVVESINEFFDEYIKNGFITSVNGRSGQVLKVYKDYCTIYTKNEDTKQTLTYSMRNIITNSLDDEEDDVDELGLSVDDKITLAKSFMRGSLVKNGLGMAVGAGIKKVANDQAREQKIEKRDEKIEKTVGKHIKVGERKLLYRDYQLVDSFSKTGMENGYLRFVPIDTKESNLSECDYFFFKNSIPIESKRIFAKVLDVQKILEEKVANNKVKEETKKEVKAKEESKDQFEEVRKYKQLLDEGIITEEEFNKKKKELLNL